MSLIDHYRRINIFQIGVGGTGSWLVPPMCKFLNNMSRRFTNEMLVTHYVLLDDDIVSEENIIRQNFDEHDIGRSKVMALIRKYSHVYSNMIGLRIRANTKSKLHSIFKNGNYGSISMHYAVNFVFGCGDNNKTRRALFNYFNKYLDFYSPVIYFDSGNDVHHGQIVTTAFEEIQPYEGLGDDFINSLRLMNFRNGKRFKQPPFLKMFPAKKDQETNDNETCAFFGDQTQSVNMLAANMLFINFQQAVLQEMLPPPVINFNNAGYSTFEL